MDDVRLYDAARQRLVYLSTPATPEFWDKLWQSHDVRTVVRAGYPLVGRTTSRFLAPPARVLEGGCGWGNGVYELKNRGFDACGVDFAPRTVSMLNEHVPELNVRLADVRKLPFEDGSFDGYWSLGVIEHFWDGYEAIRSEMRRVLRPGGFLFLTVPAMSPLRRLKAALNAYPRFSDDCRVADRFYQFALTPRAVIAEFAAAGFEPVAFHGYDALKGLKDEIEVLKPALQYVYNHPTRLNQLIRRSTETLLSRLTYHVGVYVLSRRR